MLKGQLLGDYKSSHFLQHLRNLSSNQCDDVILKSLFIKQLPQPVRAILAASAETDLGKLAAKGHQIMDLQRRAQAYAVQNLGSSPNQPQAQASTAQVTTANLLQQIDAVSARLDKAFSENRHGARGRSRNRLTNRSRSKILITSTAD